MFRRLYFLLAMLMLLVGCQPQVDWRTTDVTGKLPPLEFTLTDMEGKVRHGEDYRGKVTLLFTGFTHCPGICPATLARLSTVLEQVKGSRGQIQVLFVSLDPQRDTPKALKAYVQRFGPWFVGLTGNDEQLDDLMHRFFLSYRKEPPDESGRYDVIHSDIILIFDRQGHARLLARSNTPLEDLEHDLQGLMEES